MKRFFMRTAMAVVAFITLVSGCDCKHGPDETGFENVMILYSVGHNGLDSYLIDNIYDLKSGFVPQKKSRDAILVVSHLYKYDYKYKDGKIVMDVEGHPEVSFDKEDSDSHPVLIRVYKDKKKRVVMDTVFRYDSETILSQKATLNSILSTVRKQYPSQHYGMIFSSHSSGWMPKGYYSHPEDYESVSSSGKSMSAGHGFKLPEGSVRYVEEERDPDAPMVKSLGSTTRKVDSHLTVAYELDLPEFCDAIPMHLDYLIVDACLAGGIELAYQLKDKCDRICFSPAEVLAEGMNYKTIASHLLEHGNDVEAVAEDFFKQFNAKSDEEMRSATISVVDCTKLDRLTETCRRLFNDYREQIASVKSYEVQRYYTYQRHWFFDLADILYKAGISSTDRASLESALDHCITYKAATDRFLPKHGGFDINSFCGLSMYLPCAGSPYLDGFYKTLEWNKATELVD